MKTRRLNRRNDKLAFEAEQAAIEAAAKAQAEAEAAAALAAAKVAPAKKAATRPKKV